MITLQEAVAAVLATAATPRAVWVPLAAGNRRVLASDVVVDRSVPPWDNSAMDGYAVRAAELAGGAKTLARGPTVAAGRLPVRALRAGEAMPIMTGAPLPDGADAVVPVEEAVAFGEEVTLPGPVPQGRFVRRAGADLAVGDVLLRAGATLGPPALGLLASLGRAEVAVAARPRVAILVTGDEVVRPGGRWEPGQILSSNHLTLALLAEEAGALVEDHGIVGDDPAAIARAVEAALSADLVVTTGGVSAGAFDHMRGALGRVGVESVFWKVRVKPGMPTFFGRKGAVPVVALPGNPVSAYVNFLQLARPWIRRSMGDRAPFLQVVEAVAGEDLAGTPGRARLERVRLTVERGRFVAWGTGDDSSGVLSSMLRADGLMWRAPDQGGAARGETVLVQRLDTSAGGGATLDLPGATAGA